ncbi:ribonuclease H-like domain-containing protein [Tanacetum coccineum]
MAFSCTLAQYVAYKTNVVQQFTPQMHYRLPHPGQGILGPAPAIYASQPTTRPSALSTMPMQDPTWHMDTGASSHLNFNASNLSTIFDKRLFPSVHVGDGKSIPVTNTGHSIIPSHHRPLHLHNVLVTPNIIKNLISVRQFTRDNNCTIEFDAFGFSVKDYLTRHILLRCDSSSDLYPVTKPLTSPSAFLSTSASTWHQRLGHPGDQVLRSLVSSRFISCNKEKSSHICHACQLGKHVKLPFHSSDSTVEHCFDIIHSDLWTSPIVSSSGFKYYVLFLDHFSHYLWIYPLRSKSDMFDKFLHFRTYVKNQFKCEIKSFQCDHGGEFDNNRLHNLFVKNGIQFRFSCPKTSQQNGKAERMIRTINNIIRTLLFQAHLPPTFWVEALHMATYLLNLLPSTAIRNEVPFTRLFNKQPDYSRLRIFGCLCYPHLHSPHKLAPRATPCIFLGYPAYHRGYRCLDLETNKIILSRHVTFDETQFPYKSMTPSSPPSYQFLEPTPSSSLLHHTILNPTTHTHGPTADPQPNTHTQPITDPTQSPPHTNQSTSHEPHNTQTQTQNSPLPPPIFDPPNPQTNTNPVNEPTRTHPMITRSQSGIIKPIDRLSLNTFLISPIPKNPSDALKDPQWRNAMYDEYNALVKNGTWLLVPRPGDVNMVRSMWLFKHKFHADGTLSRYKARLVANGSSQQLGVDFDETFSPVVKPATIRTVLSLAVSRKWPIHQLDVKNAFLNGDLSETVYMHQPPGFVDARFPNHVCRLQRSLYGLKQAPRAWFQRFAGYATRAGFYHSRCDSSLFLYRHGSQVAYLLIYVDDIILTTSSPALLQQIIYSLHNEFDMIDLGALNYYLGISADRNSTSLFLSQRKNALQLLEHAHMVHCNPSRTPVDTESKLGPEGVPV